MALEIHGERIVSVHNQINPDKLRHLGPVGDLTAMMAGPG